MKKDHEENDKYKIENPDLKRRLEESERLKD